MANSRRSGHIINASNFVERVNVCSRHEDEYLPSNPAIALSALELVKALVGASIEKVSGAKVAYTKAIAKRQQGYDAMDVLAGRMIHMLNSSEAADEDMRQGKALLAKYRSERVGDIPDIEAIKAQAEASGEEAEIPKTISVSQQGFINRLAHFRDMIVFLEGVEAYQPNEEDMQTEGLESFAASVEKLNKDAGAATSGWLGAIEERNKLIYKGPNNAYLLSKKMREYVDGAYSKKSLFYEELKKYPVRTFK